MMNAIWIIVKNWVGSPIDGFDPNPIYIYIYIYIYICMYLNCM